MSSAVVVFIALCGLLVAGKFVRIKVPLLQRLYLPSSVIGGAIGLVVMSIAGDAIDPEIPGAMRRVPGFLINVVFATLFLGVPIPNFRRVVSLAFPQLVLGQIMAWGQYVVGLGLAGFVLSRLFGVPPCFGNLIEIGFEGGHGTVGGMTESFLAAGWSDGAALGFTVATAGMIVGIVVGMALVNWAQAKGIVKEVVPFGRRRWRERLGVHLKSSRPAAGFQTVMSDSIDSLAWHLAIVGVSAIATISVDVVAANWIPLVALILAGTAWSVFAVLWFGPRCIKEAWFERAIADFGQATGVTATGLMLLRTVDPESKTCAAASFGYKQLLHEPIMGGGLWTAFAFTLVIDWGWMKVFAVSCVMLAFWIGCAHFLSRRKSS